MSSMKLFKPSYSYETNQRNFSKYEHEEHNSQSNYAKYACDNKFSSSSYDSQGREYFLGHSDANESSHLKGNMSTNYYAHAQSALPSPSIHVQEGHHMMGKMKRHESHVGQEWASNSSKCSNPAMVDQSRLTMHNEKHMVGEMEHGWPNKPNQYLSPTKYHRGQSMYKEGEQEAYNYASNTATLSSPKYLSPIKTNRSGLMAHKEEHMMGNMDRGWANSTSQSSSPTGARHRGHTLHDEDHMIGKGDFGWVNSPTKFSSSNQSHQSGLTMHKKEHMMENDHGWALSPNKFSNSNQNHHAYMSIPDEEHMVGKMGHGWANLPNKFSGPAQTHHSDMEMHNEEHMMGKVDHGWSNSPSKFSSSTHNHRSDLAMHNQEHMVGNMDHGWSNSPSKFFSPTQNHHSGLAMHKQDVMGSMNRGLTNSPNKFSSSSHAMHKEEHMMGKANHGWAKSPTKYSGPNHYSTSNNTMHGEHEQYGWAGKSNNEYGPNQVNYSAHTSYDDYEHNVDEDVHDIMDEILSKYPSHNVSGGHGSSWAAKPNTYASENQAMGYAKQQQAYDGSAHYGSAAQSMTSSVSKFAVNKEMNAGYSSNCNKEEYSASSSTKKFESKSMISRRG